MNLKEIWKQIVAFLAKQDVLKKIIDFFTKKVTEEVSKPVKMVEIAIEPAEIKSAKPAEIDWNNPKSKISKYFTVNEALLLREWGRLANEADGLDDNAKAQLVRIFQIMDTIRELLGKPVFIKSAYRPKDYNVAIGGATFSAHMASKDYAAVDFWTDQDGDGDKDGEDCDDIKALLMPKLAEWGIRMEDNGKGARWVHIDNKVVPSGGNHFFKP